MNTIKNYPALLNGFLISTDKSLLDISTVYNYLSKESYWAKNIPLDVVQKSITGSVCFGMYEDATKKQIGFARIITDGATFAWLADVFILPEYRGKGLSKWLMKQIIEHPDLQGLRRWLLATKDAHGLYAQYGFALIDNPERFMRLTYFTEYPAGMEQQ